MRVAINTRKKKSWGGGNHFSIALTESLVANGCEVTNNLKGRVDAIIMVFFSKNSMSFGWRDVKRYKKRLPHTVVLQRVNNLDTQRKTRKSINNFVKHDRLCDASVFVSNWAREYAHKKLKISFKREYVVQNQVRNEFRKLRPKWARKSKLSLVIHHWSINPKKGFEVYRKLGRLKKKKLKDELLLTYIGRYTKKLPGFSHKGPLHGNKLIQKISSHHIYFTASQLESGPYHVLEAINCGLPVIYWSNGGAIKEYVGDCGYQVEGENILKSISDMRERYDDLYDNIVSRCERSNIKQLGIEYKKIIKELKK